MDSNADRSDNYRKGVIFTNLNCAGCLGRWLPEREGEVRKDSGWSVRETMTYRGNSKKVGKTYRYRNGHIGIDIVVDVNGHTYDWKVTE